MKLPFRLCASWVGLMLVCSCGCFDLDLDFASFANPTVEPEKAKIQKGLYGSYILTEVPQQKEGDGDLFSPEVKVSSATKVFHIGKAGDVFFSGESDCYVLNMPAPKETDKKIEEGLEEILDSVEEPQEKVVEWKPDNYEGYMLFVLKPTQVGFALHYFDSDKLRAEMKAGRLSGDYMTKEEKDEYRKKQKLAEKEGREIEDARHPLMVKASPPELRGFFKQHLNNVIDPRPIMLLKRVK